MFKWFSFIILFISVQVLAQTNSPDCEIYHRVTIGMDKISAIKAVGEPYNHTFEMKPQEGKILYRFELNKEEFIELYLTFDEKGLLSSKNIAGAICAI